jgi:hypothetical protein
MPRPEGNMTEITLYEDDTGNLDLRKDGDHL